MELSAELTNRDGTRRPFRVSCERTLQSLLSGLERLRGEVSAELSQLVVQERGAGAVRSPGDVDEAEEEDNDDEEEDEEEGDYDKEKAGNKAKNGTSTNSPPTKRTKLQKK